MMWIRFAIVAAIVIVATSSIQPVAAAQPVAVRFEFYQDPLTFEGRGWQVSGAVTDSGSWYVDRIVFGAPQTSLLGLVDSAQTGALGTFHIQWEGGQTPFRGDFASWWLGREASAWRLYAGTSGYTGVVGQGRWTLDIQPGTGYLHFVATGFLDARR
jgi:hypothetical protein